MDLFVQQNISSLSGIKPAGKYILGLLIQIQREFSILCFEDIFVYKLCTFKLPF